MENNQISLTIQAAQAGGLAVFEYSHDQPSVLVFSGNLNETTEYLNGRMGEMLAHPAQPPATTMPAPAVATFRKVPAHARPLVRSLADAIPDGDV